MNQRHRLALSWRGCYLRLQAQKERRSLKQAFTEVSFESLPTAETVLAHHLGQTFFWPCGKEKVAVDVLQHCRKTADASSAHGRFVRRQAFCLKKGLFGPQKRPAKGLAEHLHAIGRRLPIAGRLLRPWIRRHGVRPSSRPQIPRRRNAAGRAPSPQTSADGMEARLLPPDPPSRAARGGQGRMREGHVGGLSAGRTDFPPDRGLALKAALEGAKWENGAGTAQRAGNEQGSP